MFDYIKFTDRNGHGVIYVRPIDVQLITSDHTGLVLLNGTGFSIYVKEDLKTVLSKMESYMQVL